MSRVVPFPDDAGVIHEDDDAAPVLPATPVDEMRRVAEALATGDDAGATAVLERTRRALQVAATDELYRLVGRLVTEVAMARTPREKVGRAVAEGSRLIGSRPPRHVVEQLSDPSAFVDRCVAAYRAIVVFLGEQLNTARHQAGLPRLDNPGLWIEAAIESVLLAVDEAAVDGLERKTAIARSLMAELGFAPQWGGR